MSETVGKTLRYRWLIFWILAGGYLLVYFHRLCPAVVAVDMMDDLKTGETVTVDGDDAYGRWFLLTLLLRGRPAGRRCS